MIAVLEKSPDIFNPLCSYTISYFVYIFLAISQSCEEVVFLKPLKTS